MEVVLVNGLVLSVGELHEIRGMAEERVDIRGHRGGKGDLRE